MFFQRFFICTTGENDPNLMRLCFKWFGFNHPTSLVEFASTERFEPGGSTIIHIKAREIFDSRGNPTVEVGIFWNSGSMMK